jgi:hypothetical protein
MAEAYVGKLLPIIFYIEGTGHFLD